jgi:hypothetical protein
MARIKYSSQYLDLGAFMEIIDQSERNILKTRLSAMEYDLLRGKQGMTEMMFEILTYKLSKLECDNTLNRMFKAFPLFTDNMVNFVENELEE